MSDATIVQLFQRRAESDHDRVAIEELVVGGAPCDAQLTWGRWHDASRALSAFLIERGVQKGDRVVILAGNRNIWPIADLAVLMSGAISVGCYPTSSAEQVVDLVRDSGAVAAICDCDGSCAKLREAMSAVPSLALIIGEDTATDRGQFGWREAVAAGHSALAERSFAAKVDARAAAVTPDDPAVLIYTSGSTGAPKGARLLHRNLRASAESVRDTLGLTRRDSSLSFLPYSHSGERIFGLYTRILTGMRAAHVQDGEKIWAVARATRPTLFGGLPRWFEKIHEALMVETKGRDLALSGREVVTRFVGDNVRLATSGGAKLSPKVAADLDAAGLTILGAYGQTEHLCAAFHRPDRYDFETVGFPMPGTEVKLDDDGELLIRRSDLTFDGYHNRPEETSAAFTADGEWLRTGDLASIEPDGRIRITGRKKELIALSNGKKIAPLPIEAALAAEPWISSAMLYGEGERFISALIVPSRAMVDSWLRERGIDEPFGQAVKRAEIRAEIERAIEHVNARFSRPEQVRRWVILEHELSAERGELTPTMKIRRGVVTERYRDRLTPLYR